MYCLIFTENGVGITIFIILIKILYSSQLPHENNDLYIYNTLQILPNGEEMIPAVIYFANALYEEPLKKF